MGHPACKNTCTAVSKGFLGSLWTTGSPRLTLKMAVKTLCVCALHVLEWQTSLQPSAVAPWHDMNHFSASWNASNDGYDSMSGWSHMCGRDVANKLNNYMNPDDVYNYSPDPDHEPEEYCTAKQPVVDTKIMVQVVLYKYLLW